MKEYKCYVSLALGLIYQFQVGNWKKFFTPEKAEEWARWIEEKTAGTRLTEKKTLRAVTSRNIKVRLKVFQVRLKMMRS